MKTGIQLITKERQEQIEKHKVTIQMDVDFNNRCQLTEAASILSIPDSTLEYNLIKRPLNWDEKIWAKMCKKRYIERLIIAGALIAAELDRIQFNENRESQ